MFTLMNQSEQKRRKVNWIEFSIISEQVLILINELRDVTVLEFHLGTNITSLAHMTNKQIYLEKNYQRSPNASCLHSSTTKLRSSFEENRSKITFVR